MPNRMLRDWTDSERVNGLAWQSEVFFVRLIMKVDDYGRFTANPKLLRSFLFPLKDCVRDADITRCLAECEKAGLIAVYQVEDKSLLEIVNFDQRLRAKVSRYPARDSQPAADCQTNDSRMTGTCQSHDSHVTDKRQTHDSLNREARSRDENSPPKAPQGEGSDVFESLKKGISKMYNRKESTVWSDKEKRKLREVASRPDAQEEFDAIESLYESGNYEYFRRDIITLLNNWPGEVDRARLKGIGEKPPMEKVS